MGLEIVIPPIFELTRVRPSISAQHRTLPSAPCAPIPSHYLP